MGRKWTAEQKAAASARAKARLEPKQLDIEEEVANVQEPQTTVKDDTETNQAELLNRAIEAIAALTALQANNQNQTVNIAGPEIKNGKLTGTLDRFSVKKGDYEDFTPRLGEEPALRRFGFKENFELTYKFEVVRYQTIDNIWMQEPKMTIDLNRKIYDEETGALLPGRYKEFRVVIHEDPDTAIQVARMNGLDVPEDAASEKQFLNEMRYLQVRDWLLECFMPKKPSNQNNRREMVVNGKLVEYFETNSENTATLPFDQLRNKL